MVAGVGATGLMAPAPAATAATARPLASPSASPASIVRATVPAWPSPSYVLKVGSRGALVTVVQKALLRKGFAIPSLRKPGAKFGFYGVQTGNAVLAYKKANPQLDLGSTPRVGPRTYRALTAGSSSGTPTPTPSVPGTSPHYTSIDQCPTGTDPTTTDAARNSRDARKAVGLYRFVRSPMGCKVTVRESGGDCTVSNPSGKYLGKWQLDMWEWPHYGGLAFASRPNLATCAEQDVIAFRNWVDRGWDPWTTAY